MKAIAKYFGAICLIFICGCSQNTRSPGDSQLIIEDFDDTRVVKLMMPPSSKERKIVVDASQVDTRLDLSHIGSNGVDSTQVAFYPKGNIAIVESFFAEGESRFQYYYYPNGRLKSIIRMDGMNRVGNAMFYDSIGRLSQHSFYNVFGQHIYFKRVDEAGKTIQEEGKSGIWFRSQRTRIAKGEVYTGSVCVVLPRFVPYVAHYHLLSEENDTLLTRKVDDELIDFEILIEDEGNYRLILMGQTGGIESWVQEYFQEEYIRVTP